MRKVARLAALMASCLLAHTGCYTYKPVLEPRAGMDVRARLNNEAAVRRSQGLDEPMMRVDGTVVEATASSLSLDVVVARSSSAFQNVVIRDTVRLDIGEIQSILSRKFSPLRTALFTVGAGAAAIGVVMSIDQIVGGTGEEENGGDPTLTVPLLTFRWLQRLYGRR